MLTIRSRLTTGFMIIILAANLALALVISQYVNHVIITEVQTRVRLDLNAARTVYEDHIETIETVLRTVSHCGSIIHPFAEELAGDLGASLQRLRTESDMDLLTLIDLDGRVLYRAHNPEVNGDDLSKVPLVASTLKDWRPARGTIVLPREILEKEGKQLCDRALIDVLDTPEAASGGKRREMDGMVVGAAVPFPCEHFEGQPRGVLFGANLLNRRYEIVDRIKDIVFQGQLFEGKDIGTSTIFLGDLRISTNVMNVDGSRAVGSRMSAKVSENVFGKKQIYADRAFVVNDWYITAYEPISDPEGRAIGALYVGLLEKPFARTLQVVFIFFLITLAVTVLTILTTLFFVTQSTLKPIGPIVAMCRKVIAGDLTARVGISPPGEMGVLCKAMDRMAEAVEQREKLIHQKAQQQIGQSEKLASIGRLAAGIAHEINNPLTGVLTFAHLLKQKETMGEEDRHDLDVIIRETTRVREIVRGLLDFARQSPPAKEMLDLNEVIRLTTKLLRSQKEFRKVRIDEFLDEKLPQAFGDKNQLQQVFLNLCLNACEAMHDGGILTIRTLARDEGVHIVFEDTGTGIKKEHMDKIFDPFFTTKPVGKGTGLGLSVSYGTIQSHNGAIQVESEEGKGAAFTVILPAGKGQGEPEGQGGKA